MKILMALFFLVGGLTSGVAHASHPTFEVTRNMTKYYYAKYATEAAMALLWQGALEECASRESGLPILMGEIKLTETGYTGTATGEFACIIAGRE